MKPCLLIILDGFGLCHESVHNPINAVNAPFFFQLLTHFSHTQLAAAGKAVGLPDGYVGNSQVGHMAIGVGKVVEQAITIINQMIANHSFFTNTILLEKFTLLKNSHKRLHIMGIASNSDAHGHIAHIVAYIKLALQFNIPVYLHLFLDGRDVAPFSAAFFIEQLTPYLNKQVIIATLHGRFYAMDRDNNQDRTNKSIAVLTQKNNPQFSSWQEAVKSAYADTISDEFLTPCMLDSNGIIQDGDGIVITNTRPERVVQLAYSLQTNVSYAWMITAVSYGSTVQSIPLVRMPIIENTLRAEWIAHGKKIFTIAETEKWAHVTYFFDGMQNKTYTDETRVHIPSLKEKTYETHPEMSASVITQHIATVLQKQYYDLFIVNYANADMVAHAGNPEATAQAIQCLDIQLKTLYEIAVLQYEGTLFITADHGNAECTIDHHTGQIKKCHTVNKVPLIIVSSDPVAKSILIKVHELADIKQLLAELCL